MGFTLLKQQWQDDETAAFNGWDFSYINNRSSSSSPPWDYPHIVKAYLRESDRLLDMGTGGGEVLLTLGHPHANTSVTEAWQPNYELCLRTLAPLGIKVMRTYGDGELADKLPFEDHSFDIIINRHESFDLAEVDRTLRPGGYFITQQVGNRNDVDLYERFYGAIGTRFPEHILAGYSDKLSQMGYRIVICDEAVYPVRFFDVGALVFWAKQLPWEFPDFSVERFFDELCACHREIGRNGWLEGTTHRFVLAARKAD